MAPEVGSSDLPVPQDLSEMTVWCAHFSPTATSQHVACVLIAIMLVIVAGMVVLTVAYEVRSGQSVHAASQPQRVLRTY